MNTPKQVKRIVMEFEEKYGADAPRVATRTLRDSDVIADWLTTTLTKVAEEARAEERQKIVDLRNLVVDGIDACKEDSAKDDCVGDELQYIFGKSQALKIILKKLDDII